MKEKLIELLKANFQYVTTVGTDKKFEDVADEILALGLYPKEFVEDMIEDSFTLQEDKDNMLYGIWTIKTSFENNPLKFRTLDELYEYWNNEIKKK